MLVSICLVFCQFKPSVGYKSVAYKKARIKQKQLHDQPQPQMLLIWPFKMFPN